MSESGRKQNLEITLSADHSSLCKEVTEYIRSTNVLFIFNTVSVHSSTRSVPLFQQEFENIVYYEGHTN